MAGPSRELPFPEKFRVLFSPGVRYFAFYGGRGGTKSWSVATWLLLEACERRLRIVCGRQFQASIRDSSKALLEARIRALDLESEFRITEQTIVHVVTGSAFIFVGLSVNPDWIRSFEGADILRTEEAASISQRVWDILVPTVRAPGSILICCWNPNQPTDPVDRHFRGGNPPENAVIMQVGWEDNPWFDQSPLFFEKAKLERDNPAKALHVYGGYDIGYESSVFPGDQVRHGRPAADATLSGPYFGADFGYSQDPFVVAKLYIVKRPNQRDQLYIQKEVYAHQMLTRELPALLDSILRSRDDLVWADGSRPEIIADLNEVGFNVRAAKKGARSVREGIANLQNFEILIDPDGCSYAYDEFRGARWPTDRLTGKVIPNQNPVGGADHVLDACRFAISDINALVDDDDEDYDGGVFRIKLW